MRKLSIGATSFVVSLLLASCGQKQDFNPLANSQQMSTGDAATAKPMPSEASLNFSLEADKPNIQLSYGGPNLTECQLAQDPSQNRLFFSVGFIDATTGSAFHTKIFTNQPDLAAQPITDTQRIYGDGENSGSVSVTLAGRSLPFTNRDFLPNMGRPMQSQCTVTYTLAESLIKGKIFCSDLMDDKGQATTGAIKFACAVGQLPRAQAQNSTGPIAVGPKTVAPPPAEPATAEENSNPVLVPEGKI